jgi:hypothetical protein
MNTQERKGLIYDFFLPALLFMTLGGMTWAVRGCSGYGAVNGCVFAGVAWGAAWWFISREPGAQQSRRYNSGWIILAMTVGIGMAGARGWMQWPSFFEGHLLTNAGKNEYVPISRVHGFIWLFIAGVPWAGLGACMLAWCNPERPARATGWLIRITCGIGGAVLAKILFDTFPEVFLPLYKTMQTQYHDFAANPNLKRLFGDNRLAIIHLGLFIGFLSYEIGRRDWRNVTLISVVGLVNGLGWSLCQNWKWAHNVWPNVDFNWWRCWESSGGISIGLAYGIAFYLVNSPESVPSDVPVNPRPNAERFGAYLGLIFGLGFSIKNGLKGWANIYIGNEEYWSRVFSMIIGPLMILALVLLAVHIWKRRPLPAGYPGDVFPHAFWLIWIVLITQNVLAQLITGPHSNWTETAFSLYYVVLFLVSGAIVCHDHALKKRELAKTKL